jgi:hypothetical protein
MARGQSPSGSDYTKVVNYVGKHAEKIMGEKPALFKLRGWILRDTGVDMQENRIQEVCDEMGVKWAPVREGVSGHTQALKDRCAALEAQVKELAERLGRLEESWKELLGAPDKK